MSIPVQQIMIAARRAWYRLQFLADLPAVMRILRYRKIRDAYYRNFWNQIATSLGADIRHNDHGYTRISRGGSTTFVKNYLLMLEDHLTLEIMGNKSLTYSLLSQTGYPTVRYREFTMQSLDKALEFLAGEKSVVVKPDSGTGGGRGVTTGIKNKSELTRAARKASRSDVNLIVEEQLEGSSFRLLFFMGKFIDAIRRDPPIVIGDGKSSIRNLVRQENELRENPATTRALSSLVIDSDAKNWMHENGIRLSDIPADGEKIQIKRAVNENDKSGNVNVTRQVNAQIIENCASLVQQFGVVFVGVDLICNDITAGFNLDNCRIGEINTTPGLHHHYLIANPQQGNPIGEMVLDHMLSCGVGTMTIGEINGNPEGIKIRNADGKSKSCPAFGASTKNSAVSRSLEYQ